MEEQKKYAGQLVFGLDIGTRSIVGTVGYKMNERFEVVAQYVREHDTRAMMDGQIHDINKVGQSIIEVKEALEKQVGRKLESVCIAAAGRVLRTLEVHGECEFEEEIEVTPEHIYSLDSLCVEKAHGKISDLKVDGMKFHCVGYTVIKYYLNDYPISNLESHKAKKIGADMLVTFLPDDVVDGLYKAVAVAGLEVAALTLEPIAAMNVAIPQMYRMLNIALVDVGAGTSDICITKEGSIVAYGMIPFAGDELTEAVATQYLLDFASADKLKIAASSTQETVSYTDIMGITHQITAKKVTKMLTSVIDDITGKVADKIVELNGGKPVSAVFVVGGGGKITGFTERLADKLGIMRERVALRGEEVMDDITFWQKDIKKDPLLVTPIGICLNFYDQKNNFIFVNFNHQRIKLYDNSHLTIVDAAMQAGFPNEALFPRRGKEITYTIDGKQRIVRGSLGEPAVITLDGEPASINTPIEANMQICIQESVRGAAAEQMIEQLPEYNGTISFLVNGVKVECPKFVQVNGALVSGYYSIQDGDKIQMLKYYTVSQILEFMDVLLDYNTDIYVNNQLAFRDTIVYENFSIDWEMEKKQAYADTQAVLEMTKQPVKTQEQIQQLMADAVEKPAGEGETDNLDKDILPEEMQVHEIRVSVNEKLFTLGGKKKYTFIDAFDAYGFDMAGGMGKELVQTINGVPAQFISRIRDNDTIEIYWK